MKVEVIIPFRLREGADMRRAANLEVVQAWWYAHGFDPKIVSDGLEGDAQFNRHRAYNRAVSDNPADVYVFTEADMLIHPDQIYKACFDALKSPGLVVPFTQYRYLSDGRTNVLRDLYYESGGPDMDLAAWWGLPADHPASVFQWEPESTMDNGRSIGAVNVVSRNTLDLTGGFTEATSGNWYDDNIIEEAFAFLTGHTTRWVPGPAVHLYHLPGHKGAHLTVRDKQATEHNRYLLKRMRSDIASNRKDPIRNLMAYRTYTKEN